MRNKMILMGVGMLALGWHWAGIGLASGLQCRNTISTHAHRVKLKFAKRKKKYIQHKPSRLPFEVAEVKAEQQRN